MCDRKPRRDWTILKVTLFFHLFYAVTNGNKDVSHNLNLFFIIIYVLHEEICFVDIILNSWKTRNTFFILLK